MPEFLSLLTPQLFLAACLVALVAGFIKGAVGFGMPMVMISGLTMFLPADTALAALILPTLLSNGVQALRQGGRAAVESILRFRLFLLALLVCLVTSAQLYRFVNDKFIFLLIGVPILIFSVLQLVGWKLRIPPHRRRAVEVVTGGLAGLVGGVSGVWGPPTVAYLTAQDTPKSEQMRVQGVIYGIGAVALTLAHVNSGVLNTQTLPVSLALLPVALAGVWLGLRAHDRVDQAAFRKATLAVLLVAGLNLIRKALLS